jgi:hypothetical protein
MTSDLLWESLVRTRIHSMLSGAFELFWEAKKKKKKENARFALCPPRTSKISLDISLH